MQADEIIRVVYPSLASDLGLGNQELVILGWRCPLYVVSRLLLPLASHPKSLDDFEAVKVSLVLPVKARPVETHRKGYPSHDELEKGRVLRVWTFRNPVCLSRKLRRLLDGPVSSCHDWEGLGCATAIS